METEAYPVRLFRSKEDGGFIAEAVDLPGCSAFGETMQDACRELQDAICAWVEAAEAAGNAVPLPSTQPAPAGFSGRIALRCPKSLHATLSSQASMEGVSLNTFIVTGLSEFVTGKSLGSSFSKFLESIASMQRGFYATGFKYEKFRQLPHVQVKGVDVMVRASTRCYIELPRASPSGQTSRLLGT